MWLLVITKVKMQVVRAKTNQEEHDEITESFYKYQVLCFKIMAVWQLNPSATRRQRWLYQLRFGLLFGIVAQMLLLFAIRVVEDIDQLHVILHVVFIFATEASCMVKMLVSWLRQRENEHLRKDMHSKDFQARCSRELHVFKDVANTAVTVRNYYALVSIVAATLILLTELFLEARTLPAYMYEPCDLANTNCYYGLYAYQLVSLFPTAWVNMAYDSMSQSLLSFVRAQLVMLSMRLESLEAAQTPEDNDRIALELRDCCIYYARIVRLSKMVNGFIRIPFSVQLLCSVLVLVSNLYVMSTSADETLFMIKLVMYQFVLLLQILIICHAANEMTHQSSLLGHALYKSEWITWNKSNRRMVLLMMLRFNSPLLVTTIDPTQSISLPTFATIVNSSYSYFALLKRVNS